MSDEQQKELARLEALRLANALGGDPHQVTERAAAYYAFLVGEKRE